MTANCYAKFYENTVIFLWNGIQKYIQELKNLFKDRCELRKVKKGGAKWINTRNAEVEEKSIGNVDLTWKSGNMSLFLE